MMLQSTHGAKGQKPNERRMCELMLYIAARSSRDDAFGQAKLNRLLFYSDLSAYLDRGRSITGYAYLQFPQGPVANDLHFLQDEMVKRSELRIESRPYVDLRQRRPIAMREPDLSGFAPEEIDIVDKVIAQFADFTASEMSEFSHQFEGWKLAEESAAIPYAVAFIDTNPALSDSEVAIAQEVATELAAQRT